MIHINNHHFFKNVERLLHQEKKLLPKKGRRGLKYKFYHLNSVDAMYKSSFQDNTKKPKGQYNFKKKPRMMITYTTI